MANNQRRLFLWALIACFGCGAFDNGPSSGNTPQEMFENVIESPIPKSISKLEGVGDTWQGYGLFLRFQAQDADIDQILDQGYKPTTWAAVQKEFAIPRAYNRFSPSWNPAAIANKECHIAKQVSNQWTGSGTHYLVIDRSSGTVYFYGAGG